MLRPSGEAVMLDVKLGDGSIESFLYTWLSRVKYQPGDTLMLRFGKDGINIEKAVISPVCATLSRNTGRGSSRKARGRGPEARGRIVITEGEQDL